MPSAFITGINGFLGQTLARVLLADGWQVGGLMRANAHRGALGNMSGLRISYGDLLDSSAYAEMLNRLFSSRRRLPGAIRPRQRSIKPQ